MEVLPSPPRNFRGKLRASRPAENGASNGVFAAIYAGGFIASGVTRRRGWCRVGEKWARDKWMGRSGDKPTREKRTREKGAREKRVAGRSYGQKGIRLQWGQRASSVSFGRFIDVGKVTLQPPQLRSSTVAT